MSKGDATRSTILEAALAQASTGGLEGLSIGGLAREVGLSKSGLFAHFNSKENLQLQVLEKAEERFVEEIVLPAIRRPRGEPRVRALFEGWLAWAKASFLPGGCPFVATTVELDDRPGKLREYLVAAQSRWLATIARAATIAVEEKHFHPGLDTGQFAYELYSILLAHHLFRRLLRDPQAEERSRKAFERLLAGARRPEPEGQPTPRVQV